MLNEKNINFYTLICMEFGVTGDIDIHVEINTGSIKAKQSTTSIGITAPHGRGWMHLDEP